MTALVRELAKAMAVAAVIRLAERWADHVFDRATDKRAASASRHGCARSAIEPCACGGVPGMRWPVALRSAHTDRRPLV